MSRGRKGTDSKQILKQLEKLAALSEKYGPRVEVPMLMHVITAQFDLVKTLDDYMETPVWKKCASNLERVTSVLEDGVDGKQYTLGPFSADADLTVANLLGKKKNKMKDAAGVGERGALDAVAADTSLVNPHTGKPETEDERAERLRVEKEASMTEEELRTIPVVGSLSLFMNRLDEEFSKSLQRISSHSSDYIIRLRDEAQLVALLSKSYDYFIRTNCKKEAAEIALRRVEHMYYCHDSLSVSKGSTDDAKTISDLCTFIYQEGGDRAKTRAMLCHIYHHALHDRFMQARDLLLMSHLQENIQNVGDVPTMILFNRMMANMGLSAFRLGRIWDAHQCLSEICGGRNHRELLAQGMSTNRYGDKSVEYEKAEKRRQIPYHQHINLELLEACHLISAMLLEVPNMAAAGANATTSKRFRVVSRNFRKQYEIYNRQVFTGPPEQIKDYIMSATKALLGGDWKTCADYLTGLEIWSLVPGDSVAKIQEMLVEKIKIEGLRTFLYAFSKQYDSLSLTQLCEMFDLTKNEVHSVVSKMMINREIHASWDQPTDTIVLRKVQSTSLHVLALQFAEKAANLVEANERLLDIKTGNFHFRDDSRYGDQGRNAGGQRRSNFSKGGQSRGNRKGGRNSRTNNKGRNRKY